MLLLVEIIVLLLFASIAIRLALSLRRERSVTWQMIMERIGGRGQSVASVAFPSIFCAGIVCSETEVWARMGGQQGISDALHTTKILLDSLGFIVSEERCPDHPLVAVVAFLRWEGFKARIMLFAALANLPLAQRYKVASVAVVQYIAFVSYVSYAISDFRPDLLQAFTIYLGRR